MLRALPDFYRNPGSKDTLSDDIPALLRDATEILNSTHTPTPVLSSAINYIQTLLSEKLPTNLIQAMRDSFGAHGIKRIGSDTSETFSWK